MTAYRRAVEGLAVADLTRHYTDGLRFFHEEFVPQLKERLAGLAGGAWDLADFEAYAAGSDVGRKGVCTYAFGLRSDR